MITFKVKRIVAETINSFRENSKGYSSIQPNEIRRNAVFNLDIDTDSLAIMEIISKVEELFLLDIPNKLIPKFKKVNDLINYVEQLI